MIPDPTSEIRAIRNQLAAACDYDVDKIVDETVRHQDASGHSYINLRPLRPPVGTTTNQSMRPTGMGSRDSA